MSNGRAAAPRARRERVWSLGTRITRSGGPGVGGGRAGMGDGPPRWGRARDKGLDMWFAPERRSWLVLVQY